MSNWKASNDKSQYPSVLKEQPKSIPIILINDSKMVKSNMSQHDITKIKANKHISPIKATAKQFKYNLSRTQK